MSALIYFGGNILANPNMPPCTNEFPAPLIATNKSIIYHEVFPGRYSVTIGMRKEAIKMTQYAP